MSCKYGCDACAWSTLIRQVAMISILGFVYLYQCHFDGARWYKMRVSECSILAQKDIINDDNLVSVIQRKLCRKLGFEHTNTYYEEETSKVLKEIKMF